MTVYQSFHGLPPMISHLFAVPDKSRTSQGVVTVAGPCLGVTLALRYTTSSAHLLCNEHFTL